MKKKLKIAIKTVKWLSNKAKHRFNELKSEYENIVYNIDRTYWHTIDIVPTDKRSIIFYVKSDKFEHHYYILLDKMVDREWHKIIGLGAKYWAYCDDLFNID